MAKRVIALVKIIHDGTEIMPGDEIVRDMFDRDKLTRFYERGVITIEDVPEGNPTKVLDLTPAKSPEAPVVPPKE